MSLHSSNPCSAASVNLGSSFKSSGSEPRTHAAVQNASTEVPHSQENAPPKTLQYAYTWVISRVAGEEQIAAGFWAETLKGYLAHRKRSPHKKDPTVGPDGDPEGGAHFLRSQIPL